MRNGRRPGLAPELGEWYGSTRMISATPFVPVLLVEDDAVHGLHLTEAVQRVPGGSVSAWLKSAAELRAYVPSSDAAAPAVVLVDLGLPDDDGVRLVAEVRERWPEAYVLVVSVLTDERSVVDAIRNGACGYVVKDGDTAAVSRAIQNVLLGQNPISPGIARYLMRFALSAGVPSAHVAPLSDDGSSPLTPRECEILQKIGEGLSYIETAEALGVTRSTVESHIRNLYRKLEAHSKTQALVRARERGLL